jgi:hypothetical protein
VETRQSSSEAANTIRCHASTNSSSGKPLKYGRELFKVGHFLTGKQVFTDGFRRPARLFDHPFAGPGQHGIANTRIAEVALAGGTAFIIVTRYELTTFGAQD